VANPCTGAAPAATGTGLAGMRARVEALGGEFSAGPRAASFRVHARLPTGRPA
jgi:signal transduction histidine kinase